MKKLVIVLFLFLTGCVSLPPHLTAIHQQAPVDIGYPTSGNSMILFEPGHPKLVGFVAFDNIQSDVSLRNFVNAVEFKPGKHKITAGILHRYGELNLQLEYSSSIEYTFEEGKKYNISIAIGSENKEFILSEISKDKGTVELARF